MSEKPDLKQNLKSKQPNVMNFEPPNDGWKDDLSDPTDKIRVGLREGKDSSITKKDVGSSTITNVGGMQ